MPHSLFPDSQHRLFQVSTLPIFSTTNHCLKYSTCDNWGSFVLQVRVLQRRSFSNKVLYAISRRLTTRPAKLGAGVEIQWSWFLRDEIKLWDLWERISVFILRFHRSYCRATVQCWARLSRQSSIVAPISLILQKPIVLAVYVVCFIHIIWAVYHHVTKV